MERVSVYANYMKRLGINIFESKSENKKMTFIEARQEPAPMIENSYQELITPKNDLELIIGKGVKVSVSSEISSEKLISIIEFLRNL